MHISILLFPARALKLPRFTEINTASSFFGKCCNNLHIFQINTETGNGVFYGLIFSTFTQLFYYYLNKFADYAIYRNQNSFLFSMNLVEWGHLPCRFFNFQNNPSFTVNRRRQKKPCTLFAEYSFLDPFAKNNLDDWSLPCVWQLSFLFISGKSKSFHHLYYMIWYDILNC